MVAGDRHKLVQPGLLAPGPQAGVVARDEAGDHARMLHEAGVDVRAHRVDGLFHGTFGMTALVPQAQEMYDLVQEYLAPRLQPSTASP